MKRTAIFLTVLLSCSGLPARDKTQEPRKAAALKIGMTSVFVNSPVEAFKFYTEKVGFVEVMYRPEMRLAIVASPLDPDGTVLLLEPNDNPVAKTYQGELYKAGIPVIVFSAENIREEYRRLIDLGVVFKQAPTETEWGIEAVFDDGCGNWIMIHQEKT